MKLMTGVSALELSAKMKLMTGVSALELSAKMISAKTEKRKRRKKERKKKEARTLSLFSGSPGILFFDLSVASA